MRSPAHLLHRAGQVATALFDHAVPGTLTPRQFAVLTAIAQYDGANQTILTAATGIDRSTLSDVVRRLTQQGYVQRQRSEEDARAYVVRLTNEGRDLVRVAGPKVARTEQKLLACIPQARRASFVEALHSIAIALGKP